MTDKQRPEFTIRQAADSCQVSAKKICRRIDKGDFRNAHRNGNGPWLIPVEDLLAARLQPGKPSPPDDLEPQPAIAQSDADLSRAREAAPREQRSTATSAEAELRRADQTIETQATALKMIEAAPAPADQLERLAAERDEARANARWAFRRRLRKPTD